MLIFRTFLICAVTVCGKRPSANAATSPKLKPMNALTTQNFYCNAGYDPHECEQHVAKLKAVLIHYPASAPKHWSWVLVRSEDWQPLLLRLHLPQGSPAFTAFDQHEIFLEEALFLPQSIRADELVRDFHATSDQLLSLAVSHELGHVICDGGTEAIANRIAEQLRSGKYPECGKSLSPIDELYLHSHLPGFPHLQ
ncbi:MAG: hypothetical protein WBD25_12155 [Terriglobales bacterium]|jgi:hypothetical protein